MNIKIFKGMPDKVEEKINDWLSSSNNISISKILQSSTGNHIVISILYIAR